MVGVRIWYHAVDVRRRHLMENWRKKKNLIRELITAVLDDPLAPSQGDTSRQSVTLSSWNIQRWLARLGAACSLRYH